MYPGFAKTAREEGLAELAEWFETLAKAEKSHAGRFNKGLDRIAGREPADAAS
jgi:rubrerythrin